MNLWKKTKQSWGKPDFNFGIWVTQNNTAVGRIGIRPKENSIINLGYWLHPDFQGKGYMTEAVQGAIAFAFKNLQAKKVIAEAATWNIGSIRVMENSGMQQIATDEKIGFEKNGVWVPEYRYSILNPNL